MQHRNSQPIGAEILQGVDGKKLKIGIVTSQFHSEITNKLQQGALEACERHGVKNENIEIVHVRGSFETPLAAQRLVRNGCDGVIVLGCVIRGATTHYDYVCEQSVRGLMDVMLSESAPVGFGIATVETIEQAFERAGGKENLGENATLAVLDLLSKT